MLQATLKPAGISTQRIKPMRPRGFHRSHRPATSAAAIIAEHT
ncbi:hypothetical protein ACI2S5_10895 [Ralstonia nicotianae]|nr:MULTISPECIES: hypothetical protein [Ralstonia]AGH87424.1 miscellaneous; unknown [Ralstonia pseudosolanacearum FQY_4]ANH35396.1 hypothetical protein A3768_4589 [Ralstonia solanacearum]ESS48192.1 hypothetical protein L665_02788 [Ralstonia solanacearum SD54]KAF3458854.1 hypothetical protein GO278_003610 [Ralstonia solanacearum]MDC6292888.1 hypothetical protein [Ralstonia pseudosolanacearum]